MKRSRFFRNLAPAALVAFSALICSGIAAPQKPPSAQPPTPTPVIRTYVRQVLVPVVVTDKKGHYITDLKPSDFTVFEEGIPQTIVAFSTETRSSPAVPGGAPAAHAQTVSAPAKSAANDDPPRRSYLVCVDTLHSSFSNFGRVRNALSKFFEQEKDGAAQYSLIALGWQIRVVQDSTRNAGKILSALQDKRFLKTIQDSEASGMGNDARRFTELMRAYCANCACQSYGTTHDGPRCPLFKGRVQLFLESSRERTAMLDQNFLLGLKKVVNAMTTMPTARTIILISDGINRFPGQELYAIMDGYGPLDKTFEFNPQDENEQLQAALRLAVRYDVRFYTIDSRGLYSAPFLDGNSWDASMGGTTPDRVTLNETTVAREKGDTLAELAERTGGLFFHNNNDLLKAIRKAFADGREFYVLAYVPKSHSMDGKYRSIKVTVKRKHVVVHAKSGYWATK